MSCEGCGKKKARDTEARLDELEDRVHEQGQVLAMFVALAFGIWLAVKVARKEE